MNPLEHLGCSAGATCSDSIRSGRWPARSWDSPLIVRIQIGDLAASDMDSSPDRMPTGITDDA